MQMVNMDKVLITEVSVCANNPYEPKFPYYGQTYSSGCEHSNPTLYLWGAANQVCLKGEELKQQLSECMASVSQAYTIHVNWVAPLGPIQDQIYYFTNKTSKYFSGFSGMSRYTKITIIQFYFSVLAQLYYKL